MAHWTSWSENTRHHVTQTQTGSGARSRPSLAAAGRWVQGLYDSGKTVICQGARLPETWSHAGGVEQGNEAAVERQTKSNVPAAAAASVAPSLRHLQYPREPILLVVVAVLLFSRPRTPYGCLFAVRTLGRASAQCRLYR